MVRVIADVRPLGAYGAAVDKRIPRMRKPFTIIAVVLLLVIALLQLLRFIMRWEVTLNGVSIPVWASAIACLVAAGLAVMVWVEARR
jgi:high-affinity Fe2+/Pb2+ permease